MSGDNLYEVSYRSTCGAAAGPIGHLVIRRLDDHAIIAEVPAHSEVQARSLLARAEDEVRGPAEAFEAAWGIGPETAADRGPEFMARPIVIAEHRDPDPGDVVMTPRAGMRVFPDAQEVFAEDQAWLAELLHPLLTLDLSTVNPQWQGQVCFLSPIEPESGLLGEDTAAHANDYACENWLSFRVQPDGRWRYLGERRLFAREDARARGEDALESFYASAAADFRATRARWDSQGALVWGDEDDPTKPQDTQSEPQPLLSQFGGEPGYANWVGSAPPPRAFRLDESDASVPVLRLQDGRPFHFIGIASGYPWRTTGADAIVLFFEPETATAVLTFDWG